MNYDKNSFLSGIAVGRQLKGWATDSGRRGFSENIGVLAVYSPLPMLELNSASAVPAAGYGREAPRVIAFLEYANALQIRSDITVPAADFGEEAFSAGIACTVLPLAETVSVATVPAAYFGAAAITVNSSMEVNTQ